VLVESWWAPMMVTGAFSFFLLAGAKRAMIEFCPQGWANSVTVMAGLTEAICREQGVRDYDSPPAVWPRAMPATAYRSRIGSIGYGNCTRSVHVRRRDSCATCYNSPAELGQGLLHEVDIKCLDDGLDGLGVVSGRGVRYQQVNRCGCRRAKRCAQYFIFAVAGKRKLVKPRVGVSVL